jgi:hypothetical protein
MKKSLQNKNPYLKDADKFEQALLRTVVSSTIIEGVFASDAWAVCSGPKTTAPKSSRKAQVSGKSHH